MDPLFFSLPRIQDYLISINKKKIQLILEQTKKNFICGIFLNYLDIITVLF